MKKVIISLLVIASLFAFVSCKDEVTYDKWAKMPVLDTNTEKGAVVTEAVSSFEYYPDSFDEALKQTTYNFNDKVNEQSGTLVKTEDKDEEMVSYKFKGSYKLDDKTYKSFEFKYDGTDYYDAKGTTKLTGKDSEFAAALSAMNEYSAGVDSAELTAIYEATNLVEVIAYADETPYTISKITVKANAKGYNEKIVTFELDTYTEACDYEFEITYNEGETVSTTGLKTLKATYSLVRLYNGMIGTVSLDKKTYILGYDN